MTRVAVIGAGAVGCATASALVRAGHEVTLIEAKADVGAGTSKANTAIWHTGFDAKPGTREAGLVARGHRLLTERAEGMNWPLERTGALLVAWDDEQLSRLDGIVANAEQVGYHAVERLTVDDVYAAEPHLGPGARGALRVPDEGLLDPWSIVIGLATDAVVNGATLLTSAPVTAVERRDASYRVTAGPHVVDVEWIVNAAGLHSDDVDRMLGEDGFTVTPRRGQLIVFDKLARGLLEHIILPVPTATTKGVLVSPTVYGNILLGPTAEDLPDKNASQTTQAGLDGLLAMGRRILPALLDEEVTATYAGLRAATEHSDYCLAVIAPKRYVRMGGIRSTGISSCLALAEEATLALAEHAGPLRAAGRAGQRPDAQPRRGTPAAVCGRRPHLPRSRVRAHRVPVRAGDQRRDPGCAGQRGARTRHRRHPTAYACAGRPMRRLPLRGDRHGDAGIRWPGCLTSSSSAPVPRGSRSPATCAPAASGTSSWSTVMTSPAACPATRTTPATACATSVAP